MISTVDHHEIRHFHLFSGMGGAARGGRHLQLSTQAAGRNLRARFTCLGGVDVDDGAVRAFTRYVGARGTKLDLFSLEQYRSFHGRMPPPTWREAAAEDLQRAAGNIAPDIVVTSPPCKGFSGLVSESRASSARYAALNALTVRGIELAIRAWEDDPPAFWLLENVPRLVNRGSHLLGQIVQMLSQAGYVVTYTIPDLGRVGGLAQSRKRLHLVARHEQKVPVTIFEPPDRPLRAVGEVLGAFPLPGDPLAGPLHELPSLEWRTWVRLALIRAGGDWRDLQELAVVDGALRDFALAPGVDWHRGVMGVLPWGSPAGTITGRGGVTTGAHAVADPRPQTSWEGGGKYRVTGWREPAGTVIAEASTGNGAYAVADPRPFYTGDYRQLGIQEWDRPCGTVTAQRSVGQGPLSIADPRVPWGAGKAEGDVYRTTRNYGVVGWDQSAAAVTASARHDNGPWNIADPRCPRELYQGMMGVAGWEDPAGTVTAEGSVTGGRHAIADPRLSLGPATHSNVYRVTPWDQEARTVTGSSRPASGSGVIADPRLPGVRHNNVFRVICWHHPSVAVTAGQAPTAGGTAIADPRLPWHPGASSSKLHVFGWGETARTVTGADRVGSGAPSVADPRLGESAPEPPQEGGDSAPDLPHLSARGVWIIQAIDGTWHRPMSVLERAALQGLVEPETIEDFAAAVAGVPVSRVSEWVGNAIPPPAMEETLRAAGLAILLSRAGETFALGSTPVWVKPFARGILLGSL